MIKLNYHDMSYHDKYRPTLLPLTLHLHNVLSLYRYDRKTCPVCMHNLLSRMWVFIDEKGETSKKFYSKTKFNLFENLNQYLFNLKVHYLKFLHRNLVLFPFPFLVTSIPSSKSSVTVKWFSKHNYSAKGATK